MTFKHTRIACYIAFLANSVTMCLTPLLFTTFSREFGINLDRIAVLISSVYLIQVATIVVASNIAEKVGYRILAIIMHVLSAVGILGLAIFPYIFPTAFSGLITAIVIYSVGNGLIETIINPILEALPSDRKAAEMSFLHSFYSWGQVLIITLSTLYFAIFGTEKWQILPIVWSVFAVVNIFLFSKVPLKLVVEEEDKIPVKKLFTKGMFLLLVVVILCAGPIELCISQWASMFAESGLGVSKSVGDLLGPCAFVALMGVARLIYGFKGEKINLEKSMFVCGIFCFLCYLLTVFAPTPILSLIGCAFCGFFVGILWPGTISLTAREFPQGGTSMFGVLSLAGYLGGAIANMVVGGVSGAVQTNAPAFVLAMFPGANPVELGLKAGLLCASGFAVVLVICMIIYLTVTRKKQAFTSEKEEIVNS